MASNSIFQTLESKEFYKYYSTSYFYEVTRCTSTNKLYLGIVKHSKFTDPTNQEDKETTRSVLLTLAASKALLSSLKSQVDNLELAINLEQEGQDKKKRDGV